MAEKFQLINMPDGNQMRVPEGASWEDIHERVGNYLSSLPPETIDTLPTKARLAFGLGQGAIAAQARKNLAGNLAAQTAGQYEQDISDAAGQFAGTAAAAIPAAVAAPFTAGASLPAAMGIAAGAGALGGLAREGTKAAFGSNELPRSEGDLAKTLAVDAVLGAAGEGAGRAIAKAGVTLAPKLLERAASKFEAGQNLLEQAFVDTRGKLTAEIRAAGRPSVDVGSTLETLYDKIATLPRGRGAFGKRFTDPTNKAAEILRALEEDMATSGGGISSKQPLDSLIRLKGSLQQMAWKEKSLAAEERQAFKQAAISLDAAIRKGLASLGGEAPALYERSLDLMKTQVVNDGAVQIAENFLKSIGGKLTAGAAIGGAAGGYQQKSLSGALAGAAGGALVAGSANALAAKTIPWMLERTLSNPEAGKVLKEAINYAAAGKMGQAHVLAARAFGIARIRQTLKDFTESETAAQQERMNPERPYDAAQ